MKKFLVALLVLLLSVSIFAGGAKEEEKGKSITYVTLGDTGLSNGYLQKAAEAFKEKTGVEVVFESWSYSDAYQKILTLAESGNFPDAMYGFSSWTELFMEAGWTVPINEYVSQEFIDDFSVERFRPDIRQHGHGSSGDGGQYCSGAFQRGSADQ